MPSYLYQIEEFQSERRDYEHKQERRKELDADLEEFSRDIDQRDDLEDEIGRLETAVEDLQTDDETEILAPHGSRQTSASSANLPTSDHP